MIKLLYSLWARLVTLILLIAAPGVVMLAIEYWRDREAAMQEAQERAVDTLRVLTNDQARLIEETQSFLKQLALAPELQQQASPQCAEFLARVLALNAHFVNLGAPSADGELRCNARPLKTRVNVADRPYIRRAMDQQEFSIGEFQTDRAAGVTSVNFAHPVLDASGSKQVVAAAVAVVSLDWWSRRLAESRLPNNSIAYIADATGNIIAHFPEDKNRLGKKLDEFYFRTEATAANETEHRPLLTDGAGLTRIFASIRLEPPGARQHVIVGMGIPFDEQLAAIHSRTLHNGIILAAFMALMILLALWGVRVSILSPLKRLKRSTEELESGLPQSSKRFKGAMELVQLQERFARMASKRLEAEERLKLAASVFTHAREGIFITDTEGTVIDVNRSFCQFSGRSRDEIIGRPAELFSPHSQTHDHSQELWNSLRERDHWYGEVQHQHRNGHHYTALLTVSAVKDEHGKATNYVALLTDITLIKAHEHQLEHIAHYDALTNLPNRVLLADRLTHGIMVSGRRGQSLAVAYLDLDGFKAINDTHGHGVGDRFLVKLAERLKTALREGDTLARIGGDEFVAVLLDLETQQDCDVILQRMLQAAAEPVDIDGLRLQVSASIGVTLYPQDGADADVLIRHADQAMYNAKQAGKNRYHLFDVQYDEAQKNRRVSQQRIRLGLERGEFVLHYQPKVNMRHGQIVGMEALVRWQDPDRGLVPPCDFLPFIEDHALGIQLGEWVIDRALAQMDEWLQMGLELPVSVNVSAVHLQRSHFASRLGELLGAHPRVPGSMLELEVLETSALEDVAQVSQLMTDCMRHGVKFSLDDFGTGYSSLTYLKRLPATLLKIDQSFVRDMLDDADDLAIVQGVIGLANAFGHSVIAEGVETEAHGSRLLQLGCELAQGYGISRPLPAQQIPQWVADWQPPASWVWQAAAGPSFTAQGTPPLQ